MAHFLTGPLMPANCLSKETLVNVLVVLWGLIRHDSVPESILALSQQSEYECECFRPDYYTNNPPGNIRAAMTTPRVQDKITSMLEHRSWSVRRATVSATTILSSDREIYIVLGFPRPTFPQIAFAQELLLR
jgi:hypothetical protein